MIFWHKQESDNGNPFSRCELFLENTKTHINNKLELISRGTISVVAFLLMLFLFCGCITGETGSRTVVGNHFALPKLTSTTGECELNIYESTEGAVVTTRKDCAVKITYSNTYTNSVLGIYEKVGAMTLSVRIEPTETEREGE